MKWVRLLENGLESTTWEGWTVLRGAPNRFWLLHRTGLGPDTFQLQLNGRFIEQHGWILHGADESKVWSVIQQQEEGVEKWL